MKERLGLFLLAVFSLSACNEQNDSNVNSNTSASYQGRSFGVFGKLRPQASADTINEIHNEEDAARRAKQEEIEKQIRAQQAAQQAAAANNPENRKLPDVASSSFTGNLPTVNGGAGQISGLAAAGLSAEQQRQLAEMNAQVSGGSWAAPVSTPPPPPAQSYGINYTTPSPGFVPPPPAVSLSTQAVPMYGGAPPPDYNPYANPYGYMQAPPSQPPVPTHTASSGFGAVTTGASKAKSDDDDSSRKKKEKPMQIITPTGMDARSPYKQRDELRMLWKGALATSLQSVYSDSKFAEGLSKVDVGLPSETSKGSLSVPQRQIDNMFKNMGAVDKKVVATVKKTQSDLVQAYYRYLYSYNKFFLTQQQVQARKQELDCAESQAEKQRATVDLANSQQEADASKDDMRSAQNDLAALGGASAARTVIKNVSGVTPTLDIAQADSSAQQSQDKGDGGGIGGLFNVFGFGHGKSKDKDKDKDHPAEKVASADNGKEKKEKEKDVKEKKKGKGDKDKDRDKEKAKDRDKKQIAAKQKPDSPAPAAAVSAPAPAAKSVAEAAPVPASASQAAGPVSFELKDVKTTPRKSILRVVVKNSGGDNFSFDADSVTVAEGSSKLADASINAEFDSTIVQPSQEVSGTITIFGRPWNDRLTVSLSSGNKSIFLRR